MVNIDEPVSHYAEILLLVWPNWGEAIGSRNVEGGCNTACRQGKNKGRGGIKGAPCCGEIIRVDAMVYGAHALVVMGEQHVLDHLEHI